MPAASGVLPGFIDAHAHLGVWEEGEGWAGADVNEMTDPNGARLRALDAIYPVVIWSGDPLDVLQCAERVFVSGHQVYRYTDGRGVVSNPYRTG